jgi:hypothetical protein
MLGDDAKSLARDTTQLQISDVSIRLPLSYDADRMQRDLEAVRHFDLARQPGPYHDGGWKGLSLHSQGGKQGAHPGYAGLDHYFPTEALSHTPYFKEILDGLSCPKKVVRLLTLPPGAKIEEHNDAWANFYCGTLRLHVPIVTHDDVDFVIHGHRCVWRPGELWYGDFSLPHWVANRSSVVRVHMVIDVEINHWLLGLFPAPFIERVNAEGDGIATVKTPIAGRDDELVGFACDFKMPSDVMPLFGGGKSMSGMGRGARGSLRVEGGRLVAVIDDKPVFALERVGEETFNIVGLSSGCAFEITRAGARGNERVARMTLILRGLPEDLYAAQLGYQQGPMLYSRRVPFPLV